MDRAMVVPAMTAPMMAAPMTGAMPGMQMAGISTAPAAMSVMPDAGVPVMSPVAGQSAAFMPAAMAPAATTALSGSMAAGAGAVAAAATRNPRAQASVMNAARTNTPTANTNYVPGTAGAVGTANMSLEELHEKYADRADIEEAKGIVGSAGKIIGMVWMADLIGRLAPWAVRNTAGRIPGATGSAFKSAADVAVSPIYGAEATSVSQFLQSPKNLLRNMVQTIRYGPQQESQGIMSAGGKVDAKSRQNYGTSNHSKSGWLDRLLGRWETKLGPVAEAPATAEAGAFSRGMEAVGNRLQPVSDKLYTHYDARSTKALEAAKTRLDKAFAAVDKRGYTATYHHLSNARTELAKGHCADMKLFGEHLEKARGGMASSHGAGNIFTRFMDKRALNRAEGAAGAFGKHSASAQTHKNLGAALVQIPKNIGKLKLFDAGLRVAMAIESAAFITNYVSNTSTAIGNLKAVYATVNDTTPDRVSTREALFGKTDSPVIAMARAELKGNKLPGAAAAGISAFVGAKVLKSGFHRMGMMLMPLMMAPHMISNMGGDTPHILNAFKNLCDLEAKGQKPNATQVAYLLNAASPDVQRVGANSPLTTHMADELVKEGASAPEILRLVDNKAAFMAFADKIQTKIEAKAEEILKADGVNTEAVAQDHAAAKIENATARSEATKQSRAATSEQAALDRRVEANASPREGGAMLQADSAVGDVAHAGMVAEQQREAVHA